jgi:hypothetical protein
LGSCDRPIVCRFISVVRVGVGLIHFVIVLLPAQKITPRIGKPWLYAPHLDQ